MKLIIKYEGFREKAYKCPAGIWTIGYGSTHYKDGSKVKAGDIISQEDALKLMYHYINTNIKHKLPSGLNNNQKEALYSLIYNIGINAFIRSSLYTAILKKDKKSIFKNWDWISADGRVMNGLIKRRAEELLLFFTK